MQIERLTIKGFKSIRSLEAFQLNPLNVLIGANGAGKSNFVSFFRMLSELVEGRLQSWVTQQGGADRILYCGVKETNEIESKIEFGINNYNFKLKSTAGENLSFTGESAFFDGPYYGPTTKSFGSGHLEARLKEFRQSIRVAGYCYQSISGWKVFHFHDTSDTAAVKRRGALHDNVYLRPDAGNLAAFLFRLKKETPVAYDQIRRTIQLAVPFFDEFVLRPTTLQTEEEQINLQWRQKNSDYPLWPSQLSDGSLRFICLATALLQPAPPTTIFIDEPELGLHPYAISLLGGLLRSASTRMQVIVSTQSVPLVNEFSLSDLIVVEREDGASIFKRLNEEDFAIWLEDYSTGELWVKNVLGGRPKG